MTTPSELGPEVREEQLAALRKQMSRALRRGEQGEFDRLRASYDRLKDEHVMASHREMKSAMRAQRAQVAPVASRRWRLPRGFGTSPLARERAMQPFVPEALQVPARGHLSPWRRGGSPMAERVWRPGR